jgi:hypothetical protein
MDLRVRGNNDGTLYLADWPEPPVAITVLEIAKGLRYL